MLQKVYNTLFDYFGPQGWWPAESPLEVMIGAVLTQNTAWTNVEKAMTNLRNEGALSMERLLQIEPEALAELIRPAGYYRLKAKRLKNLLQFVADTYDGSLEKMFATEKEQLREALLSVNGIGPETADSILLYAGEFPVFVVDTYTARVFKRHGFLELEADYFAIQDYFESGLPHDAAMFNEYHALLVRVAKEYCRKNPNCDLCPLAPLLPESGRIEI